MSKNGIPMQKSLDAVRQFLTDVSLMLQTADGLLMREGWNPIEKTRAIPRGKQGLDQPEGWMPGYAYRIYEQRSKSIRMSIGVLFGHVPEFEHPIEQPFISAAVYKKVNAKVKDVCSDGTMHGWHETLNLDGKPVKKDDVEEKRILKAITFGWPLVKIENEADLKQFVTDPLIQQAKEL